MQEDTASGSLDHRLTIRVSQQELDRMEELMRELQASPRYADGRVRVTQRLLILEALDALVWRLNDRRRPRKGQQSGDRKG